MHSLTITKLDLVNDTTVVDVRYRLTGRAPVSGADGSASTECTAPANEVGALEGAQR